MDGAAHRRRDRVHKLRLVQQHGTTAMAIDGLGRAAKIQVDGRRPQLHRPGRILCHAGRIRAQQLHMHRGARPGTRAMFELRAPAIEHLGWQQQLADADKLADTPVVMPHVGKGLANPEIRQPLHGSKNQFHGADSNRKHRRLPVSLSIAIDPTPALPKARSQKTAQRRTSSTVVSLRKTNNAPVINETRFLALQVFLCEGGPQCS